MVPQNRLLPGFLLYGMSVLEQLARVFGEEVFRVAWKAEPPFPEEYAILEFNRRISFPHDGTDLWVIVVRPIGQSFEIGFLSPGINLRCLPAPDHFGFAMYLIAFRRPFAREREA